MLRSIIGAVALPVAGFVLLVVMTTLHAPSKVGLAYVAIPVPAGTGTSEPLPAPPPVSQIHRVGAASAELLTTTAPRATANILHCFMNLLSIAVLVFV